MRTSSMTTMLVVKVSRDGTRRCSRSSSRHPALAEVPLVVAVSDDVDIRDRENTLWGIFTRFDCERDVLFAEQKLIGIAPGLRRVHGDRRNLEARLSGAARDDGGGHGKG